jgi:hypothetical protein
MQKKKIKKETMGGKSENKIRYAKWNYILLCQQLNEVSQWLKNFRGTSINRTHPILHSTFNLPFNPITKHSKQQ